MSISTDSSALMERMGVIDTLNRMAWFQDHRRWAELGDLFADEVGVGCGGPDVELVALSRADLIANWRNGLDHASSEHVLSGITIDAAGGTAHATLNETCWIRGEAAQEPLLYVFGTAMECELRRAPAGWRITSLKGMLLWDAGDPAALGGWQRPNETP